MAALKTLTLLVIAASALVSANVNVRVTSGTYAADLPDGQGYYLNIYPAIVINMTGRVLAWEFHAKNTGVVFLGLWDVISENTFRLRNKTKIVVSELGRQVFTLPEQDRYQAYTNQVVGVHHVNITGGGIIPRIDCCDLHTKPIHKGYVFDADLPLGKIEQGVSPNIRRSVAILVHIEKSIEPVMRMAGSGPTMSFDKTNPPICSGVPSSPPGMVSYHLDCGAPVINAAVNITLKTGSCDAVLVFGTVWADQQEKLHKLCPGTLLAEDECTLCGYSCFFNPEADDHVTTAIHVRVHHQVALKLCAIEI